MILISNNVQKYMKLPEDAVIRVNMAWVKTLDEIGEIIDSNENNKVFLDFPQGRNKPPKPILELDHAIQLCRDYKNIAYFAVSNVEDVDKVLLIKGALPNHVEFVPKIETLKGIKNLGRLIYDCKLTTMMLDKEDLYTDVDKDTNEFDKAVKHARSICEGLKVNLLELEGVIFATRKI